MNDGKSNLTLYFITLKNGQTYFKNLAVFTQVFSCEFCEISKNTFFYRTPLGDCFCIVDFCGGTGYNSGNSAT